MSLSAVNACLRTRRQHPPDHQRQGKKVIPDPATKSPTLGDPINVTGTGSVGRHGTMTVSGLVTPGLFEWPHASEKGEMKHPVVN